MTDQELDTIVGHRFCDEKGKTRLKAERVNKLLEDARDAMLCLQDGDLRPEFVKVARRRIDVAMREVSELVTFLA